jgi:hypothetical protein
MFRTLFTNNKLLMSLCSLVYRDQFQDIFGVPHVNYSTIFNAENQNGDFLEKQNFIFFVALSMTYPCIHKIERIDLRIWFAFFSRHFQTCRACL